MNRGAEGGMVDDTVVTVRAANRRSPSVARSVAGGALAILVATLLVGGGGGAAWAAAQAFPAESNAATWDGQTVTVDFTEVGLAPGASATISVEATARVDTSCRQGSSVWVSIHSSATASEVSGYTSDEQGKVADVQKLTLVAQPPVISGLPCTVEVVRTITVTIRDLESRAVLVIPAQIIRGSTVR